MQVAYVPPCYLRCVCAVICVVGTLRVLLRQPLSGRLVLFPPPCVNVEASALLGLFFLGRVALLHSPQPCHRLVVVCSVCIPNPFVGVYGFRRRGLIPTFSFHAAPHWRSDVVA